MRHKKFRAESIMETIISITVLTLGVAASLTILRTSLQTNSIIGEKIVALNLAIEGIEALKNIRDTNYLRYASDPDACWLNLTATDVADCSPATSIRDGNEYYFTRDLSDAYFEWGLEIAGGTSDGDLTLYSVDIDGDGDADTEIYADEGISATSIVGAKAAPFRRTVLADVSSTTMNATVNVSWIDDRGVTHELSLTRTIANVY